MKYKASAANNVRIYFNDPVKVNVLPCALAQGQNK